MAYGIIEDGVGVRTGPPTGAVTAAKGNSTAAKVSILMLRGETRNYVAGGPVATATARVPIVAGAQGLAGTLSNSAYFNFPASARTNGPEYSVLTVIRPYGGGMFFDCGNFRIQLQNFFTDTSVQVDKAGAVQLIDARLGAGTIGTWLVIAVTYNATTGVVTVAANNGVRASATSAQTLTDGASVLGNCSTVSNDVALFAFAPTVWNGQQVNSLLGNPWQLFEADNDPVFYTLATGGTTVAVPAGALTLTGYAPTVSFTAHQTIAVPAGALTLTGFAPTVSTSAAQTIAVPAASLTLTGFAPTVAATANQSISVPAGSLTLTGYAPTVYTTAVTTIAVPAGTLTLTGYAPTVSYTTHAYIGVPAGALTLTGYAPTVIGGTSSIWTPASASGGTWTPQ